MAFDHTTTFNFSSTDYTSNKPTFSVFDTYAYNFKFANKTKRLKLSDTSYGMLIFEIIVTGSIDKISVCFLDPNGADVSVSRSQNGPYIISNNTSPSENIIAGITDTYYVLVNGDQNKQSNFVNLSVALGVTGTPPGSSSVTINYNCTVPLFKYEVGLHAYSPYDAMDGTSKLRTNLYSLIPIESWVTDTKLFSSPDLSNPALPYYYGYIDKVYKVGGDYTRSYGIRRDYEVRKKLFGKPKTKEIVVGPKDFFDSGLQTSPACVIPTMDGVGLLKAVYLNSTLSQPQLYRYYMGYNTSTVTNSNDSVFTVYSFSRKSHDPITGSRHALEKLTQGVISGYDTTLDPRMWPIIAGTPLGLIALGGVEFIGKIAALFPSLLSSFSGGSGGAGAMMSLVGNYLVVGAWVPWAIGLIAVGLILYGLLHTKTTVYSEPCKTFLHHFINTPYIETGGSLYRDLSLTTLNNGYYCDGIYYYQQSGGVISQKFLSYTNAIINDNPAAYEFQNSIQCDVPTLVTTFVDLLVLPYTSGKPLPYCGGSTIYYNSVLSQVVSGNSCCDFETCNNFTIIIPANSEFSCVSQIVADNKAQSKLDSAVSFANNQANYATSFPDEDVGELDTYFTHELKNETTPTMVTIYYDIRTIPMPIVGSNMYYDSCGCTKVLDGYYAISGITFYRTYFHTTNGSVDRISYMTYSYSTMTTINEPIVMDYLDYSSNWFYRDVSKNNVDFFGYQSEFNRMFDTTELYSNPNIFRGFVKTSVTHEDFQIYYDFINPEFHEAVTGWYLPLIDWIENESFFYDVSLSISLNIVEKCSTILSLTRGFYIVPNDGTNECPTRTIVNLSVSVYYGVDLLGTYVVETSPTETKTFVPFGSQIEQYQEVSNIVITSINSPNPVNKITYNIGGFSNCSNPPTPSVTPVPTPTPTPAPTFYTGQTYGGGTVFKIDKSNVSYDVLYITSDILNGGGLLDWWDANNYCNGYTGGGFTDWSLPSLNDLYTIRGIEQYYHPPLISPINLPARTYWSNEIYESGITPIIVYYAAVLNLSTNYDYWFINRNKNSAYVFAVRVVQVPK